jgi:hypothetical protein
MRSRLVVVAALAAAGAAPAHAQESPAQVAAAFFKAVAEERWRDAARQLDLAAFERYHRSAVGVARQMRPPRPPTVEEFLQRDPDMPRAVAEYQVRKALEVRRDFGDPTFQEFAGVTSVDSLAALPTEEAAARWLQARDFRWMARQHLRMERERGCPLPPDAEQMLPASSYVIAAAAVTDSVAYVVFREAGLAPRAADADEVHWQGPDLLELRRQDGRWRIIARSDLLRGSGTVGVSVDCPPVRAGKRPPG